MDRRKFIAGLATVAAIAALPAFPIAKPKLPSEWGAFDVADDGLLSLQGQSEFPVYGKDGGLSLQVNRYFLMPDGKIFTQEKSREFKRA